jgi:hypothetical protein
MEKKSNLCNYCKEELPNHAATCAFPEFAERQSPAGYLREQWKNNPDQSVWRGMPKRDDLGNPVLMSDVNGLTRTDSELNGSAFANFPQPADSGSLPFDGE